MTHDTRLVRTPDGRRLVVSRRVAAPADRVWDVFVDTERWPEWGPSVAAVDAPVRRITAGTEGRVRVGPAWLPFRVEACAPYRWTWRVAGVPATGHRVTPVEDDAAVAAFEVPVLAAGYVPVCRRALRRIERLAEEE